MNCGQFKDPLSYVCLPGAAPAPLFRTQEVARSNTTFYIYKNFVLNFSEQIQ